MRRISEFGVDLLRVDLGLLMIGRNFLLSLPMLAFL